MREHHQTARSRLRRRPPSTRGAIGKGWARDSHQRDGAFSRVVRAYMHVYSYICKSRPCIVVTYILYILYHAHLFQKIFQDNFTIFLSPVQNQFCLAISVETVALLVDRRVSKHF